MRVIGVDPARPGGDMTVTRPFGAFARKYPAGDYRCAGYPVLRGGPVHAPYLSVDGRERAFRRADRWVRSRGGSADGMPGWMVRNMGRVS